MGSKEGGVHPRLEDVTLCPVAGLTANRSRGLHASGSGAFGAWQRHGSTPAPRLSRRVRRCEAVEQRHLLNVPPVFISTDHAIDGCTGRSSRDRRPEPGNHGGPLGKQLTCWAVRRRCTPSHRVASDPSSRDAVVPGPTSPSTPLGSFGPGLTNVSRRAGARRGPSVGLQTVTEDDVLQVLGKRAVIPEGPDGIEDPHDAGYPEHDGCEDNPTVATFVHGLLSR